MRPDRHPNTRRLCQHRFGLMLIAVAIFLGAPLAVTFAPLASIHLPIRSSFPEGRTGEDSTFIDHGVLVRSYSVFPKGFMSMWRSTPRGSVLRFKWSVKPDSTLIIIPLWPIPALLFLIGMYSWWRGTCILHRDINTARGRYPRLIGGTLLAAALISISLTATSFITWSGITTIHWPSEPQPYDVRRYGVTRGTLLIKSATVASSLDLDYVWRRLSLSYGFHRQGPAWELALPFWPIPILLLAAGIPLFRRGNHALLSAPRTRCAECGYSLLGLRSPVCPECGRSIPSHQSPHGTPVITK